MILLQYNAMRVIHLPLLFICKAPHESTKYSIYVHHNRKCASKIWYLTKSIAFFIYNFFSFPILISVIVVESFAFKKEQCIRCFWNCFVNICISPLYSNYVIKSKCLVLGFLYFWKTIILVLRYGIFHQRATKQASWFLVSDRYFSLFWVIISFG